MDDVSFDDLVPTAPAGKRPAAAMQGISFDDLVPPPQTPGLDALVASGQLTPEYAQSVRETIGTRPIQAAPVTHAQRNATRAQIGLDPVEGIEKGDISDMVLRAVARVPEIAGNLLDLGRNTAGAIGNAAGVPKEAVAAATPLLGAPQQRGVLDSLIDNAEYLGRELDKAGIGAPSVSGGNALDAVTGAGEDGIVQRLGTVGRFVGEQTLASAPDMAAAVAALPAYLGSRTNEIAEDRVANDKRKDVTLTDLGISLPAAAVESLLERFTTRRLLPGGNAAAGAGATILERIGNAIKETALQAGLGGAEEVASYLGTNAGTDAGVTERGLAEVFTGGALAEGALGGAAQGTKEVAAAIAPRPRMPQAAPTAESPNPSTQTPLASTPAAPTSTDSAGRPTPRAGASGDVVAAEDTTDIDRLLGDRAPAAAKPAAIDSAKTEVRQVVEQLPAEASAEERAAAAAAVAEKHGLTVADLLLADASPTASNEVGKMDIAPAEAVAPAGDQAPKLSPTAASAAIDQRLASLEEAAQGALPQEQVSELSRERDEIETMLREHDQAIAAGVNLSPAKRLTPAERQVADTRRIEIRDQLERHRTAAGAADQRIRLQDRLGKIDRDADLVALAEGLGAQPAAASRPAAAAVARPPVAAQDTRHEQPTAQQPTPRPAPVLGEAGIQDEGGSRRDGAGRLDGAPRVGSERPAGDDAGRAAVASARAGSGSTGSGTASGVPAGLDVRQTDATRRLASAVNGLRPRRGSEARFREVEKGLLPDRLAGAIAALERATGTEVVIVRNLNPDAINFNGITTRRGVLYVDETADHPATTVASHEFVHQLRVDAPDLYRELETEVRRQGNLPAWLQELRRQIGDQPGADELARRDHVEELTANAVGDALTDRKFLERMARESPAPFRRMADAFMRFLDDLVGRVRGLGSERYLSDVETFRDLLADVLAQFSERGDGGRPVDARSGEGELMMSRRDEARDRPAPADAEPRRDTGVREFPKTATGPFRRWFGDSKVTDSNGAPLVVYHGTASDFWTFEDKAGDATGHSTAPFGHFFTSDRTLAERYAENASDGVPADERTVDAYLSIQKPYEMALDEAQAIDTPEEARSVRDWLEGRGYDGIHIPEADNWIAFKAEQIKSASENTGAFDPANPDIRFLRRTPRDAERDAEQRRNQIAGQLPVSRGAAGWNYDAGVWEGRKGTLKRLRASLQDKMTAWQDVQGQIESQVGQVIDDAQNVYRIENLMHGRVGEGIERIERGQVEPLVEEMRAASVTPAQLDEYLYARHAKERNAEIAKINPKMPDGGSGMTNDEADQILAGADRAKLDPLAKRVDAITAATRKRLLDHGLITQDAFDAMTQQYSAYVPLRGKATTDIDFQGGGPAGRGVDGRSAPVKAALGRGAGNRAVHILGEVIGDAQRSVIAAEKARVGRAVMRLVLANPNPKLWQVEPVQTERKVDATGEVYDAVVQDWSDPSIVGVRHRGKLYKVQINAQPLAQALNNVGVDNLGSVTRAAGALNRYFAAVLTKYNPAFLPVNASRDALFGLTGLAAEHGEEAALDAALHYPQAARAAFRQARGKSGNGQWDAWAVEFAEHGGKTGYVATPSAEDLARKIGSGKLTSYSPTGLASAARTVADTIGVLNDAVENALRLSAYVTMRNRGMSPDAAAEYAKNLTVNFNRKGFDGSALNSWFLFYNAALQGAHRTSTLMRRPKTLAYLGALAGAQIVATLAAMGMEDDNGEPLWNKVPDHVKRRNLVIVTPDGGVVTVPMPYGFNLFPYLAGRITGALLSDESKPTDRAASMTADVLGAATESFSPVPLGEGPAGLVPEALGIGLGIQTNRNDFGRPIRKESGFGPDIPLASVGRPDTLEVFKLVSKGLNRIGGGDDFTPPPMSAFDLAPEDIQYLLQKLTGGTGKFVVDMLTVGQKATGGNMTPALKPRDVPITSRFVTNIDEQAAQSSMFYERRETIERSLKRVRAEFSAAGPEAAEKMLKATPELTGAAFKRRKRDSKTGAAGEIVLSNGLPQFEVANEDSVFGKYKAAIKAGESRNDAVEQAYKRSPGSIIPTEATRMRDANVRTQNTIRQAAQHDFNGAWVRDVVGAAE
ncbi:LPD38 domain-containing protein [Lysobacter sp. CA199]|uniref:LPD38 domain-containing protein n=1 Tax=Lysobacter sp. CA199 TaxID=3455608 RepID=UPI003F8D7483